MAETDRRGLSIGLTSIGYDGEDADVLTGLPKPRIAPPPGTLVMTAEMCVAASSARLRVLGSTGATTALGRVLLCRVLEQGRLALAGPNTRRALHDALKLCRRHPLDLVLVDGAFSRIAPMAAVDVVVICTGPSRSLDCGELAGETASIAGILSLPRCPRGLSGPQRAASFITPEDIDGWAPGNMVLCSPVDLLAAHEPARTWASLLRAHSRGVRVFVRHPLPLAAAVINPTYPVETRNGGFEYCAVDSSLLRQSVEGAKRPVFDVLTDGLEPLVDAILRAGALMERVR